MEELKARLRGMRRANIHHRKFIPELAIYNIVSQAVIDAVLRDIGTDAYMREELVADIFNHGRKIFTILVLTDQASAVSRFIESGELQDAKLPFRLEVLRDDIGLSKADDFDEVQWEVTAITFRRGTVNRSFKDKVIMPFVCKKDLGRGAFGRVSTMKLDAEHQELGDVFPHIFVQKEIEHTDYHRLELENLAILNHLDHPNIIRLLTSYTYQNTHYLLFPLAEHGTLADILSTDRQNTVFRDEEVVFTALAGLASAVEHLHDFFKHRLELRLIGCHHDLRPRNILASGTTLILADFGLSKFRDASRDSATPFRQGMDDYLAPECEDLNNGFQPLSIRRSSDIWSFGCILVEVATYLAYGPAAVEEFRKQRHFRVRAFDLHLFHHGPHEAAPSVVKWLKMLEDSSPRPCRRMVTLARAMLSIEQADRPKAGRVTTGLRLLALSEKSVVVSYLLDELQERYASTDTFIERNRFTAWQFALGILDLDDTPFGIHQIEDDQFQHMLEYMDQMQAYLTWRLTQDERTNLGFLQLAALNDRLCHRLDSQQQQKYQSYFRVSLIRSNNDRIAKDIDPNSASTALDKEIRMCATLRYMTALAEAGHEADASEQQIDANMVRLSDNFGEHSIGWITVAHQPRKVIIEWRRYGHHSADEAVSRELFARPNSIVKQMSASKPDSMHTLHCCGYFHDESRHAFGVLYDLPVLRAVEPTAKQPIHLRQLIVNTTHDMRHQATLDDKFRLAFTIARSVLEFHLVGWLHKSLTTENIVFFPTEPAEEVSTLEPYIIGFNHSRPNDILAFTEGFSNSGPLWYQHPTYRNNRQGYKPEYDYYSLGVILMEIGCWRPFDEIASCTREPYGEVHERKFLDRLPRLRQYMGKDYFEAVTACINGEFSKARSQNGEADGVSLFVDFESKVLFRLRRHIP